MKTPPQQLQEEILKIEKGAPGNIREAMERALQNAKRTLANFKETVRLTQNKEGLS
jgi:hypothetical protein